jgi:hypothetical protein
MSSEPSTRVAFGGAVGLLAVFFVSVLVTSGLVGAEIPILTGEGSTKVQFVVLLGVALLVAAGLMAESPADG